MKSCVIPNLPVGTSPRVVDIGTSNTSAPNIFQGEGGHCAPDCPVTLKMPLHVDHFTLGCPRIPTLDY